MGYMFGNCNRLESLNISNFDTSKVTNMESMFGSCSSLTSLDISGWNTSKVISMAGMFNKCSSIEAINCDGLQFPNINLSNIRLDSCTKLTVESLVGLLNALPQSDKGYSFQIGDVNIAKLSDEQKAIATNKGWTLI